MSRLPAILPLTIVCLALQTGCAGNRQPPAYRQQLVIENRSPDMIRVSLDFGNSEILLGRVEPGARSVFRIQPGTLPSGVTLARIRGIAAGTVAVVGVPGADRANGSHSEWYSMDELLNGAWLYSGSRVVRTASRR